MTIQEIANFVVEKHAIVDSKTITRLPAQLVQYYRILWEAHTWTETQDLHTESLTGADTITATDGAIDVSDNTLDLVMSVSVNEQELEPINRSRIFREQPSLLTATGQPQYYAQLPKTAAGVQQIRLYPHPDTAQTYELSVLVKKTFPADVNKSYTPRIPGAVSYLIAKGEAYAESRKEKGDAAPYEGAAAAHLQTMIGLEDDQAGASSRIVPDVESSWNANDL